jgi:predicted metal-dependent phosphoesterase TrpH
LGYGDACRSRRLGENDDVCSGLEGKVSDGLCARGVAQGVPSEYDEIVGTASFERGISEAARGEYGTGEQHEADEHEREARGESTSSSGDECNEEQSDDSGDGGGYRGTPQRDELGNAGGQLKTEKLRPRTHQQKACTYQHECGSKEATDHGVASLDQYDGKMPEGPIDLHAHSSVSDGTETPTQLVRAAVAAGLGTVAITDHDSTAGWHEAYAAAEGTGLTIIPGMELSTNHGPASVHMLAYLFDPLNAEIVAETARIRDGRLHRAERIVERIAADYTLTWDDVLAESTDGGSLGRPHIADALVKRGHVPNRSAAFESILHWRSGYYEKYYAPSPLEGVQMIAAAGGLSVLAHPATSGRYRVLTDSVIAPLVDAGLFGLEVYHRDNTEDGKERLLELAKSFGLAVLGSSDYHGAGKPNRLAENTTSPEVLERLIAAGTGASPFYG